MGHRSYAISGRHECMYAECMKKSEDETSKHVMTRLEGVITR